MAEQNGSTIPIDTVLLHVGAYTDEHEAYRRLKGYGERKFPGISMAKVKFTRGVQEYPDSFFDANKTLPVGCAKTRFDEHGKKDAQGNEVERLPNECATMLVSKYLGIENDPILRRMAEETLRCDTESGVQLTELPELVKMLNRHLKNGDETILKWSIDIQNAIHRHLIFNTDRATGERTLLELFDELQELEDGKHMPDERARKSLRRLLHASTDRREKYIFELAYIVEAVSRTDVVKREDITEWLWFPLEHFYHDQVAFWAAVDECKRRKNWWHSIYAKHAGRQGRLRLCFAHTDNPQISRASRHTKAGGADITVTRDRSGHCQIFLNDKKLPGLTLDEAAAALRWYALPKTGDGESDMREPLVAVNWEELKREGTYPSAPEFYYFKKAKQLLNGSETHPDAKVSDICSQAVLDILQRAFSPKGMKGWKQYRGIPIPEAERESSANQPAPEAKPAATEVPTATSETQGPKTDAKAPAKGKAKKRKLTTTVGLDELEKALEATPENPTPAAA